MLDEMGRGYDNITDPGSGRVPDSVHRAGFQPQPVDLNTRRSDAPAPSPSQP